ncbi:MAG: hypothetical protein ABIW47_08555 [Ginsengibacter sp.]|jgi:hypothetical protein
MAILKFRIYWDEDDSVYRDVAIKHTQNFADLHHIILKSFEFDNKHQATFYRSNDRLQRGKEISVEKYGDKEYRAEPLIMTETSIGSEVKDPNQKFIYVYDFHKLWTFLVELININKEENPSVEYPSCLRSEGFAPSQYGTKGIINEKLTEIEEKYDLNTTVLPDNYTEEGEESEEQEGDGEEDDQMDGDSEEL